jgi:hypothetical protein
MAGEKIVPFYLDAIGKVQPERDVFRYPKVPDMLEVQEAIPFKVLHLKYLIFPQQFFSACQHLFEKFHRGAACGGNIFIIRNTL